jgi:hypothetical protein
MKESRYLREHSLYPQFISSKPDSFLEMIVVIPSYNEEQLIASLNSLAISAQTSRGVEVIVVINGREDDNDDIKKRNLQSYQRALEFSKSNQQSGIDFYIIYLPDLGAKLSGVGAARKIGLDEALRRFHAIEKPEGIMISFDADSLCKPNYFNEIKKHFSQKSIAGASIYFEHDIDNPKWGHAQKKAIIEYELHLRLYINFQRYCSFPFAYYTVGSSMAVTASYYDKLWGMNKRKAGEDFYFLQKFIKQGNFLEINSTAVIPSSRPSDRVPFGTGRAVGEILKTGKSKKTYNPKSFFLLNKFLAIIESLFTCSGDQIRSIIENLPIQLSNYLFSIDAEQKIKEIKENTSNYKSYVNRFYHWFDAFALMKYLHYMRGSYPDVSIKEAAMELFKLLEIETKEDDLFTLLQKLRDHDKRGFQAKQL